MENVYIIISYDGIFAFLFKENRLISHIARLYIKDFNILNELIIYSEFKIILEHFQYKIQQIIHNVHIVFDGHLDFKQGYFFTEINDKTEFKGHQIKINNIDLNDTIIHRFNEKFFKNNAVISAKYFENMHNNGVTYECNYITLNKDIVDLIINTFKKLNVTVISTEFAPYNILIKQNINNLCIFYKDYILIAKNKENNIKITKTEIKFELKQRIKKIKTPQLSFLLSQNMEEVNNNVEIMQYILNIIESQYSEKYREIMLSGLFGYFAAIDVYLTYNSKKNFKYDLLICDKAPSDQHLPEIRFYHSLSSILSSN